MSSRPLTGTAGGRDSSLWSDLGNSRKEASRSRVENPRVYSAQPSTGCATLWVTHPKGEGRCARGAESGASPKHGYRTRARTQVTSIYFVMTYRGPVGRRPTLMETASGPQGR